MRQLQTPDVTKNQVISLVTLVLGVLTSLGVPMSEANTNRVYGAAIAFAMLLTSADAVIRFGRAMLAGKAIEAGEMVTDEDDE